MIVGKMAFSRMTIRQTASKQMTSSSRTSDRMTLANDAEKIEWQDIFINPAECPSAQCRGAKN